MKKKALKKRIRELEWRLLMTEPAFSVFEIGLGSTGGPSVISIPIETTRRAADEAEMVGPKRINLHEIGYTVTYRGAPTP